MLSRRPEEVQRLHRLAVEPAHGPGGGPDPSYSGGGVVGEAAGVVESCVVAHEGGAGGDDEDAEEGKGEGNGGIAGYPPSWV